MGDPEFLQLFRDEYNDILDVGWQYYEWRDRYWRSVDNGGGTAGYDTEADHDFDVLTEHS